MKKWMILVLLALTATFTACSSDNTEAVADSDDMMVQHSGAEMSGAMEEVMTTDEMGAMTHLDETLNFPFTTPSYLSLKKISSGSFSPAEKGSFNFNQHTGTYQWDFDSSKWDQTSTLPVDSIVMFFPAKHTDSINTAKFIWSKCEPSILDSANLPTKLAMNVKFLNNPNKELIFNWEATYNTITIGNWSRIYPVSVNGLITFGNENHGDLKIAITGNSEVNTTDPENSKVNFQWRVTKGSSSRLHVNLDITFVKILQNARPVYLLTFDNHKESKMNKNTEICLKYESDKVFKPNPTVADIDSALSGYILHKNQKVADLEIKNIVSTLPATSFVFKEHAYFIFKNNREVKAVVILNKITHFKHPFRRFFRFLFHHNEHFTPEIAG